MFTIDKDTVFRNAYGEAISFDEMIARVIDFVNNDSLCEYRLSIGTDSMTYKDTQFVLAIVLHRVGRGGIYFYKRFNHPAIKDLRQKLYTETQVSIDTAELVFSNLLDIDENIYDKLNLSIHLDIGKNGPTKDLIRELEGWVTALGYEYAIKPDSYAASSIANKYSK